MKSKMFFSLCVYAIVLDLAHADPATHVYECTVNGERVFSDHVCGDDAVQRDVTVTNRMDAIKTPSLKATSHSKYRRSNSPESDTRRQQCLKIRKAKEKLEEQMRAGYTAKQDERLHSQLRKLNNQYFELRCSGVR